MRSFLCILVVVLSSSLYVSSQVLRNQNQFLAQVPLGQANLNTASLSTLTITDQNGNNVNFFNFDPATFNFHFLFTPEITGIQLHPTSKNNLAVATMSVNGGAPITIENGGPSALIPL